MRKLERQEAGVKGGQRQIGKEGWGGGTDDSVGLITT